jgi:hypothetical protein
MALVCIAPPIVEPVSIPELKDMLRMDLGDTSQDDVLMTLGVAARSWCETLCRRRFVQQTWRLLMDYFPGYIDLKLAGSKVSSPFVSGSNAVLVGIRYAIALPYPPAQSLNAFIYQNANGQVTSMITGPFNIASVSNILNQPIALTTSTPHGLASSAGVAIAGNAALLALLNGQASQVITVTGDSSLTLNGTVGTGTTIAAGGTLTGYNFVQDLLSQPARLTPIFGQMWPVARVVVNAIQVDWTVGLATPVSVNVTSGSATLAGATFTSANVGQPISLPGCNANGGALNTIVQSVSPSGIATLRDVPQFPAPTNNNSALPVTALLVNYGNPAHWELIRAGIKFLVTSWFVNRLPSYDAKTRDCVKAILGPARDERM